MLKKSKVFFKGKGSGLIIVLDGDSSYEELRAELTEKVKKSKTFFMGASEDIVFEGKKLHSEQENELADIIINHAGMEIGFINLEQRENFATRKREGTNQLIDQEGSTESEALYEPDESDKAEEIFEPDENAPSEMDEIEKTYELRVEDEIKAPQKTPVQKKSSVHTEAAKKPASTKPGLGGLAPGILESGEKVMIYNGFVRSGKLIESDGNIVIIGGVNPGGEVFAGRNVIVFGQLKGKAIAGRNGDVNSFVIASLLEPELLGISNYVTRFPDYKKEKLQKSPSIARLVSDKIIISPIANLAALK